MRHKFLLAALLLCFAAPAAAQTPDPVQFIIAPETPGPNETVLIEARGVGAFLGEANVIWRQDGIVAKQGVGERNFSFTTGALGSGTRIQVSILREGQSTITREFVFVPSLVHLVWEADTYTPPFYKGKALYSPGSTLRVGAFPVVFADGARVAPENLSYQWTRNGTPIPSASGVGRSTLTLTGDQFQSAENIEVELYRGTNKVGRGSVEIVGQQPVVLLYSRDALRGVVYDQALPPTISLVGKEITLQAEPYFFSNASRVNGALIYQWTLNGAETGGPDSDRGILTLRQTGEGEGGSRIGVTVQNADGARVVQQAAGFLDIVFGAQANNGLGAALSAAVANFSRLAQFDEAGMSGSVNIIPSGNLPPYQPLEPIPGLDQSGNADFGRMLSGLFRILISLGALLAVVMLVVAGIQYMFSDVAKVKFDAKERALGAIFGLIILAGSVLILQTINPRLLNFTNLLNPVTGSVQVQENRPGSTPAPTTTKVDGAVKTSIDTRLAREQLLLVNDAVFIYNSKDTVTSDVAKGIVDFKNQCEGSWASWWAGNRVKIFEGGAVQLSNNVSVMTCVTAAPNSR